MRKPGYVSQVILEWGFEQLKTAGSIDRLLKYKIRPSSAHPKGRKRMITTSLGVLVKKK